MKHIFKTSALLIALMAPLAADAQGVVKGAANGAEQGNDAAGPVGAIVGGAVGAVTGGINGLLGIDQRPRFRQYVIKEHRPSYQYQESLAVGGVLPAEGVEYYEVPPEYGVTKYRYTVVNDRVVLVEPGTRRIVQIVE
jgi:hypothetical protein